MDKSKSLALIGISLFVLSSVVCINTLIITPVSATVFANNRYVWLGGYLNNSLSLVNLTDGSTFAQTVMNTSWDYWEQKVNYTFTDNAPYNLICPRAGWVDAPSAIYSKELTESVGADVWYQIRLQWRGLADGYGKYGNIDVDYRTFANKSGKFAVTPGGVVPLTTNGAWIGDGTADGDGSMWCLQTLFVNVTMFIGGKPGEQILTVPLVRVDMDNWLTTGNAYCNVTFPGHPLDGIEASAKGESWELPGYKSVVTVGAGAEINKPVTFKEPTYPYTEWPMNVSIVFAQKMLVAREDLLLKGDATMDGYANVLDLGRMSDWWLYDSQSKEFGLMIGELEDANEWAQAYKVSKEVFSLDFNGDEYVNVVDLGILSDYWLGSGWSPPHPM